jgi:hypothetical protein
MITKDIVIIILVVIFALGVLYLIGDTRFKEGFTSNPGCNVMPYGSKEPNIAYPEVPNAKQGPYHLYDTEIDNTRPYNEVGTLTQQKCYEQDGNRLPEKLQDYSQRTNNYVHTYPDSCSAPFKELVGSFYAPREGAIGSPVPLGNKQPKSLQ